MYFLRVDYLNDLRNVARVRGLYPSFEACLKALNDFDSSRILLVRCELCA